MSSAEVDPAGRTAAVPRRVPSSPGRTGDGFVAAPAAPPAVPTTTAPATTAPTMRMDP